ncbi:PREDICTED: origin of replication complex subunit 3 [Tarenaya hassleriana]|uniref:origin of replication complex subunit 3 n=1 Tax=Tarenaya hassleriana TaxID=28532 RepID=UPI00053C47A5|nr:PREDICTED: origin of replication complex subunit 3 [Tarenaya hassleriana]
MGIVLSRSPKSLSHSPSSTAEVGDYAAVSESDLQPIFVLHKASSRNVDGKSIGTVRTKRRIDSPPPKSAKKSEVESVEEDDDQFFSKLRLEVFETVWSKIEKTIRDVLKDLNTKIFNDIENWVHKSFLSIRSLRTPTVSEGVRSLPILTEAASKQLYTALILTRNMEIVDDLLTFEELGLHLKSQGCHVAKLSSMDISAKNGVGGCLKSLLRQLVVPTIDVGDVTILASWYGENINSSPVVIIVDDTERCCGSVLSDLILMLSEWIVKVPVCLIMGASTTHDAPRKVLSVNALQRLCASVFTLSSPAEQMDAILEAVILKQCSGFIVSHKVARFMRSYLLCLDGTLTSFVRALKIACLEHFSLEPLSILLEHFFHDDCDQLLTGEANGLLTEAMIKHAFGLPSVKRGKITRSSSEILAHGLSDLRILQNPWRIVVLCIYEAGKFDKLRLLDIFCEALDPEAHHLTSLDASSGFQDSVMLHSTNLNQHNHGLARGSFIRRVLLKLRDLSPAQLFALVKRWEHLTVEIGEIHDKVQELLSSMKSAEATALRQGLLNSPKKHASRSHSKLEAMTERVASLMDFMLREYMKPVESHPFHEIVCFKNVDKLQSALIGDPRRRIQLDLLEFHKILCCSCCSKKCSSVSPSMHDTSIMYKLAQEHADVINLHDWYEAFKMILVPPSNKGRQNPKASPQKNKKKRMKDTAEPKAAAAPAESLIQARFCRAITELQIAGLIRMPTKRRPDFVQRVAFGQ